MLLLKLVVAALSAFVVFAVVFSALLPSTYRFEKSVRIARPVEDVEPLVTDVTRYRTWSAWGEKEPGATYVNEPSGDSRHLGAKVSWKGQQIGEGSLTTVARAEHSITNHLELKTPAPMKSTDVIRFEADGRDTVVTWSNEGQLPFPMRFFGLVVDRVVGADYARGLARLKEQLEAQSPV
ncbi:MAG: SRPBCC family protein, partial [Myxococcaceae bacterium]|nr:SRPBCC family protein [Myxococcaceae bacterium]